MRCVCLQKERARSGGNYHDTEALEVVPNKKKICDSHNVSDQCKLGRDRERQYPGNVAGGKGNSSEDDWELLVTVGVCCEYCNSQTV